MPTEVMYILEEDKQEMHKKLGCMNGIFQLFDRRFLLGQRRHGNYHKKLPQGQSVAANKFNNASVKLKDQGPNKVMEEKHRASVESSRNSVSSSCSCLDCCKQVQTEPSSFCPSIVSEPASPTSNNKHDLCVAPTNNIRDVVKDSMTRKPRSVPVKTVAKNGQKGPIMTHVDSPRLLQQHQKPVTYERRDQNLVKVRETFVPVSRGVTYVKETSRFSYDDHESSYKLQSYANIKENPRLSLDSQRSYIKHNANAINKSPIRDPRSNKPPPSSVVGQLMGLDAINCEPLKIKPCLGDEKILVSNALTRIPLEPAPWKQEVEKRVNMNVKQRPDNSCHLFYGQIEKRLIEVGLRTSGKDLRSLKHTLDDLQRKNMKSASMLITNLQKVKKVNHDRGHGRNLTPTGTETTDRSKKQGLPLHITECLTGVSPRHQCSKIRKQSNGHMILSSSKTRDPSCRNTRHIRNVSEQSDTVFLPSESDASDIDSKDRTRETKNKFSERLMEYKLMAERPSPVSVRNAFYNEDTPSPIKKESNSFKDDEKSCFEEQQWSQVDDLISSVELNQRENTIEFQANINPHEGTNENHIYIKEILSASGFLKNIDLATTIVHLHPTGSLINPELFNILEKTKKCTSKSEKSKRKLIFDTVNSILVQKLSRTIGQRTSTRKWIILDAEKLLEELCLEINAFHTNIKSEDWDDYCNEVPGLVFDVEQLVFKDLITEIMISAISG